MAVEILSPNKMMVVQVLSPSFLPPLKVGVQAKVSIRVSSNSFFLSKGLVESMGLGAGDKIGFVKRSATIYMYKTDSDDSYILASKANEMAFTYKSLATAILDNYGVLLLIENKTFSSQRFEVVKKPQPFMVAGVTDYWEIIAPRKYQSP